MSSTSLTKHLLNKQIKHIQSHFVIFHLLLFASLYIDLPDRLPNHGCTNVIVSPLIDISEIL